MKQRRLHEVLHQTARPVACFWRDRRGSALTLVAFALPVMIGFVGLGIDASSWYAQKRHVQGIADAAAIAGAVAKLDTADSTIIEAAILEEATRNGYVAGGGNQLNTNLAESSVVVGTTQTIQVGVRQAANVRFATLFTDSVFVGATAAAGTRQTGTFCVIGLNETEANTILISGNGQADIGCGVVSNSNNMAYSFTVQGNAELTANPAQAAGMMDVKKELTNFHSDFPLMPLSPQAPDPFGGTLDNIASDKPLVCDDTSENINLSTGSADPAYVLQPPPGSDVMRICGTADLHFQNDVTIMPGTYFLDGIGFQVNASASVSGDELSIILTGDNSADVGEIHLNGTTDFQLSAGDATLYPGIAIGVDPIATDVSTVHIFNGDSGMNINGVIYIPGESVKFNGGADVADGCTQIIAQMVEFNGDTFIENEQSACADLGTSVGNFENQVVLVQ